MKIIYTVTTLFLLQLILMGGLQAQIEFQNSGPSPGLFSMTFAEGGTELNVYPNPCEDELTIFLEEFNARIVTVTITDYTGRPRLRKEFLTESFPMEITIPVSDLPAGIYYVRLGPGMARGFVKT